MRRAPEPAHPSHPRAAEPADEIAECLHAVMHLYRSQQHRAPRDAAQAANPAHELTHMEARALGFFGRHPGATQSDLVAHSARDKSQLARLIGTLREAGLLEARPDEADRRVLRLHLTAAGRGVQATVQRQRLRVARLAVAALSADEQRVLVELLRRVRASLEAAGQG